MHKSAPILGVKNVSKILDSYISCPKKIALFKILQIHSVRIQSVKSDFWDSFLMKIEFVLMKDFKLTQATYSL